MTARRTTLFALLLGLASASIQRADAEELCKGKPPGSILFFEQAVPHPPLPAPASSLTVGKPMFALACLTESVGPQAAGGAKLRALFYLKAIKTEARSGFATGKQLGLLRPALPKARREVLIAIHEDFDHLEDRLDPGEYELRVEAATDQGRVAEGTVRLVLAPR